MLEVLAAIVALIKAIPIADKWAERFFVAYKAYQRERNRKENREAIRAAIEDHDQRKLEEIGGGKAGEPSNDPGAVIDPTPPRGVSEAPRNP
jgi:hypothetical protein